MKSKFIYSLLILFGFFLLISFSPFSNTASASTPYDGMINQTFKIELGSDNLTGQQWLPFDRYYNDYVNESTITTTGQFVPDINYSLSATVGGQQLIDMGSFYNTSKMQYIVMVSNNDDLIGLPYYRIMFSDKTLVDQFDNPYNTVNFSTENPSPATGLARGLRFEGSWFSLYCYGNISPLACFFDRYTSPIFFEFEKVGSETVPFSAYDIFESNNLNINYPPGYEGEDFTHIDPYDRESVKPDYSYSVSKSGEFKLKYLANITPFLTGTSYVVIDRMHDFWDGVDYNFGSHTIQPAGWLDETYQLTSHGYYMVRIDHNQQLDSPPWPESNKPTVSQVWIQFYYNGKDIISDTTIGCDTGVICNKQRPDYETNPVFDVFNSLGIPLYGLQLALLAPLDFLIQLPEQHCAPLTLPLPYSIGDISIPCMTPIYQNYFNNILVLYQTVLIGLFAYYVSIRSFGVIKDISNPRDDSIEAAQL